MKRIRTLNIFSLIFNLGILGLTIYVMAALIGSQIALYAMFFTVLSNLIVAFAALINLPFNLRGIVKFKRLPHFAWGLKYVGTVAVTVTMLTALIFLPISLKSSAIIMLGNFQFNSVYFQFHLLVPALAIISFLFFDQAGKPKGLKFPVTLLTIIPGIGYGVFYIMNYYLKFALVEGNADWYGFFINGDALGFVSLVVILVASFVIGILYWLINRGLSNKYFENDYSDIDYKNTPNNPIRDVTIFDEKPAEKAEEDEGEEENEDEEENLSEEEVPEESSEESVEEPDEISEPEEEEEEEVPEVAPVEEKKEKKQPSSKKKAQPQQKKTAEKKPAEKKKSESKEAEPKEEKSGTKVYHLTKRKEDGMWAITFVGGKRPVKLFKTKKEAEAALKILTENQGATALIRNSKGNKAGKFASSIKSDKDNK